MPRKPRSYDEKLRGERLCEGLRRARRAAGLTQSELATKADVSVETIRAIEKKSKTKTRVPEVFTAFDIAVAVRADLKNLIATADRDVATRRKNGAHV